MVEEEALDDDALRDQIEWRDSDRLAAHQRIDDERPGFAENAGYGCAGFARDPVNAERHPDVADRCPNFVERTTRRVAVRSTRAGRAPRPSSGARSRHRANLNRAAQRASPSAPWPLPHPPRSRSS